MLLGPTACHANAKLVASTQKSKPAADANGSRREYSALATHTASRPSSSSASESWLPASTTPGLGASSSRNTSAAGAGKSGGARSLHSGRSRAGTRQSSGCESREEASADAAQAASAACGVLERPHTHATPAVASTSTCTGGSGNNSSPAELAHVVPTNTAVAGARARAGSWSRHQYSAHTLTARDPLPTSLAAHSTLGSST
jgi:hypothetical protein